MLTTSPLPVKAGRGSVRAHPLIHAAWHPPDGTESVYSPQWQWSLPGWAWSPIQTASADDPCETIA